MRHREASITPNDLDESDGTLRARTRHLAATHVAPAAETVDASAVWPQAWFDMFRDERLLGLSAPTRLGGAGLGVSALTVATEEMARASSTAGLMLLLSRLPIASLLLYGSHDQQQQWIRPIATGHARAAFAMSEPSAGSDPLAIATTARGSSSNGTCLFGTKAWVSGLEEADWFAVVARDQAAPPRSASALDVYLVRRDDPAVRTEPLPKSGVRGVSFGRLHLDGAHAADRVGVPGLAGVLKSLATMRPIVAARGLGLAQAALEMTRNHLNIREIAGEPLATKQGVRWQVARLAIDVECARLLTQQAAHMVDEGAIGHDAVARLAMAKFAATETAVLAARTAVQIHGASACVAGHPAEILHRDASQLTIVEGTSEIQLEIISRQLLDA